MAHSLESVRRRILDALEELRYEPKERREEIAFHMTDWLDDLERWTAFCESPSSFSASEFEKVLLQFVLHVPNHLAAASKLVAEVPVSDVFGVGATEES